MGGTSVTGLAPTSTTEPVSIYLHITMAFHLQLLILVATVQSALCQSQAKVNFGGGNAGSNGAKEDTRFLDGLGLNPVITSGNQFVDGGLLGLAGGALAGAVAGEILGGGGCKQCCYGRRKRFAQKDENGNTKFFFNNNNNNCCNNGRRRRQTGEDAAGEKFFLPSNNCNNPCGRRKRESQGDDGTQTKFLGLFGGGNNCNQGFNNNQGYNNNNQGSNSISRRCECSYEHSKLDSNYQEEAKCAKPDNRGKRWCYTTRGSSCSDAQRSSKHPNNPWSYIACRNSGK